ncbi:MAG: quinone oxidoreductase [Devosia nanyangense]|uniref:Quinone oxidoreductase n=1 Tax=Devosia nanyangense TaxID=1228055 RepID=A0A933NXX2_9HYPH|nr:quinone oxidoreductase [Devosia nanyangense]
MSRAFVVRETGGPDKMQLEEREVGAPGPGQIRVRNKAIGVNFVDVYQRDGHYKVDLPFVPGNEGAGEVVAAGEGVTEFKPGDRVGYTGPVGAYADERLLPAGRAFSLPEGIDFETAAAVMLKGGTAHYLLFETHAVKPAETILVHAAAGGVGSILAQWATALGVRVIGTAGSDEKVALARASGCDPAINYRTTDWVKAAREATGGRGVDVVYDGVGKATWDGSLDCLRPRGLMVSYGSASGYVTVPNLTVLATKGSLYVTRPTTGSYHASTAELRASMTATFEALLSGKFRVAINQRFPLAEAPEAHRALEARQTTGSSLLIP